jgi:hypothetical protein
MRGQYKNYQSTIRSELDLIEKAFMAERSSLLEEQMKELAHLQNQRRSDEGLVTISIIIIHTFLN